MERLEQVFLARHGQTVWNTERRRQGRLDSPLTELGLAQAGQTADLVATLPIDAILTSPIGRAHRTAGIIAERLNRPVVVVEELHEVHHGLVGGLTMPEIEEKFPGLTERRRADKYRFCFPEGESYANADRRARRALDRVAETGAVRPLIVSHEMIGRMLLRNLLEQDPEVALGWNHPHEVVYRVDVAARQAHRVDRTGESLATVG